MKSLEPVPFYEVEIDDSFWSPRLEKTLRVTIGHCLDQCEESGRIPPSEGRPTVELRMKSQLPWEGSVEIQVGMEKAAQLVLVLREPAWCRGRAQVKLSGKSLAVERQQGWLRIERRFEPGDRIELVLPMEVRKVSDDARVLTNEGRIALCRGPLVYCLEGVDHGGHSRNSPCPRSPRSGLSGTPSFSEASSLSRDLASCGSEMGAFERPDCGPFPTMGPPRNNFTFRIRSSGHLRLLLNRDSST